MQKGKLHRSICGFTMLCMLVAQMMFFVPAKVEAAVNTDNVGTTMDLFTQKTTIDGKYYEIFRIPGIVVTMDGTLIAYCEARKTTSDWADIDILMVRSTDQGQTWSAPVKLVDGLTTQNTMNNPVMIAERTSNTVHLLFSKEYAQTFHLKSTDGGLTWKNPLDPSSTAPVEITSAIKESTYEWRVTATGPGHGIQLDNGRLLASIWMANGGEANPTGHNPSVVSTVYSDDYGASWHVGGIVAADSPELSNPNESTLVQLADGRVMINMRNNDQGYRRAVSISPDGISNWSKPVFDDELVDPMVFGSIARYSKAGEASEAGDKNRILFVNAKSDTAREHLTLRMSEDEGETWKYSRLLQLGGAAYADMTVGPDKSIYVFYERDPYKYLTIKKFGLDWLTSPPPMAQLNDIVIPGAEFGPNFISEAYSYDVRVDSSLTSVPITPVAFPNSSAAITINGQPAASGTAFQVPLPGESAEVQIKVDVNGQSNTYTLRIAKKRLVTNWKFEKHVAGAYHDPVTGAVYDEVFDSSGFGNSKALTFRGVEYEQGYIGKAVKFDDSPTGATINDRELLEMEGIDETKFGTGDFSVTAWVYADNLGVANNTERLLFWYGRTVPNEISQWWVRTKYNSATGTALLMFSTGNKLNGAGTEVNAWTADFPIKVGQWHHIVTQRKNGVMEIYVDGVRKVRKGSSPLLVSRGPETNLYIGRGKNAAADKAWQGKIDEVRMYNYGLSQAEVLALSGKTAIDTTALEAKIAEARAINPVGHPVQRWANLQAALTAADHVLNSDDITQSGVDQAEESLRTAISALASSNPAPTAQAVLAGAALAAADQTYELTYGLTQVTGSIVGNDLTVTFDPERFEFQAAEAVNSKLRLLSQETQPGSVRIIMGSAGTADALTDAGDLLKLRFKAKALTLPEEGTFTVTRNLITNSDGKESEVATAARAVIITIHEPGDLNGDGKFSIGDLGMMVDCYGKTSADPDWILNAAADLNGDGEIGIMDLTMIARKILEN